MVCGNSDPSSPKTSSTITKLIKEWIKYGKHIGKIKSDEVIDYYKWIVMLEEDFDNFFDLKKDINGN